MLKIYVKQHLLYTEYLKLIRQMPCNILNYVRKSIIVKVFGDSFIKLSGGGKEKVLQFF